MLGEQATHFLRREITPVAQAQITQFDVDEPRALERNHFGEIVVDARGQTSAEGVFAAGDATTTPYKQIIIATGDGAKAALSAFDHLIRVPLAEAA